MSDNHKTQGKKTQKNPKAMSGIIRGKLTEVVKSTRNCGIPKRGLKNKQNQKHNSEKRYQTFGEILAQDKSKPKSRSHPEKVDLKNCSGFFNVFNSC
uniref:40S ribosomal protein S30 n=1 Tax=Meloidogyne hapla TaxID=6305 RepID=A0A1I8BF35_MELHA